MINSKKIANFISCMWGVKSENAFILGMFCDINPQQGQESFKVNNEVIRVTKKNVTWVLLSNLGTDID